jgi:hypothetical protein
MTLEAISTDSADTSRLEEWLKSQEAGELQRDLEEKILSLLFSLPPSDFQFQKMVENLARIGSKTKDRSLLERDIAELNLSSDSDVLPCGDFFKDAWKTTCKIGRFISDHKVEILVGAAICATGFGIAAVTGYTVSVVTAGVVVAGAGSIFTSEETLNPHIPQVPPPSSAIEIAVSQQPISSPLPKLELPASITELLVTSEGIWVNGQFFTNTYLMQNSMIAEELAKYVAMSESTLADSTQSIKPEENPNESIASMPNIPDCTENTDCRLLAHPQSVTRPSSMTAVISHVPSRDWA